MTKTYKLEPEFAKSSYDEETYSKEIDGQEVEIVIINFNRWSEFEITLNDKQKEEIENKEEIMLSDYDIEFISSDDCFKRDVEIKNEKNIQKNLFRRSMKIFMVLRKKFQMMIHFHGVLMN